MGVEGRGGHTNAGSKEENGGEGGGGADESIISVAPAGDESGRRAGEAGREGAGKWGGG